VQLFSRGSFVDIPISGSVGLHSGKWVSTPPAVSHSFAAASRWAEGPRAQGYTGEGGHAGHLRASQQHVCTVKLNQLVRSSILTH